MPPPWLHRPHELRLLTIGCSRSLGRSVARSLGRSGSASPSFRLAWACYRSGSFSTAGLHKMCSARITNLMPEPSVGRPATSSPCFRFRVGPTVAPQRESAQSERVSSASRAHCGHISAHRGLISGTSRASSGATIVRGQEEKRLISGRLARRKIPTKWPRSPLKRRPTNCTCHFRAPALTLGLCVLFFVDLPAFLTRAGMAARRRSRTHLGAQSSRASPGDPALAGRDRAEHEAWSALALAPSRLCVCVCFRRSRRLARLGVCVRRAERATTSARWARQS